LNVDDDPRGRARGLRLDLNDTCLDERAIAREVAEADRMMLKHRRRAIGVSCDARLASSPTAMGW
jgi:hypothetical protein